MAVFSKRATEPQREMLKRYEDDSGFEAIGQEDFDAGEYGFAELWRMNLDWLRDMVNDVSNIQVPGAFDE